MNERSCRTCNWYVKEAQMPNVEFARGAEDMEQNVCRFNPPMAVVAVRSGLAGPEAVLTVRGLSIPNWAYWCSHWEPR